MKKTSFDCVAMKREIQERQLTQAEILKHPELARLWKAVERTVLTRQSIQ
jgi:hypothetical protein